VFKVSFITVKLALHPLPWTAVAIALLFQSFCPRTSCKETAVSHHQHTTVLRPQAALQGISASRLETDLVEYSADYPGRRDVQVCLALSLDAATATAHTHTYALSCTPTPTHAHRLHVRQSALRPALLQAGSLQGLWEWLHP
jgi:hypothetical protein